MTTKQKLLSFSIIKQAKYFLCQDCSSLLFTPLFLKKTKRKTQQKNKRRTVADFCHLQLVGAKQKYFDYSMDAEVCWLKKIIKFEMTKKNLAKGKGLKAFKSFSFKRNY